MLAVSLRSWPRETCRARGQSLFYPSLTAPLPNPLPTAVGRGKRAAHTLNAGDADRLLAVVGEGKRAARTVKACSTPPDRSLPNPLPTSWGEGNVLRTR